jgi:hypothetical protein
MTVLLENGELTGTLPGQIMHGPLYQGAQAEARESLTPALSPLAGSKRGEGGTGGFPDRVRIGG